ncbi:MAG: signal peptide peptidase SppA [Rudaea sp.]|uniref:signal peptide peptidase SppA n=1 Tax=unclassified Rudaea TaxID=2627037 RepID=UPI0010F72DEE|nr:MULTISPECIES: signal peptide peptidase SppA [unclassified Rudaea]MBN8885628.1 signal peptide peptidase SppA [Rudaea sp.]
MAEKSRGVFATLFFWAWSLFNFVRRLVFGVIAVILLLGFLIALRAGGGGGPALQERTALVLNPQGSIVEQYSSDPMQRAFAGVFGQRIKEVQLRDIVKAIDAAAADKRIERLVIEPDEMSSAGMSTLHEIGAAIDRFKAAGKDVVAVSNSMSQGQYLIAAHANQILLHPDGDLLLEGLGRYRTYYKDALDWLGVDVHLFRVGEYKSYAEPYIRNDASPESKEADLFWMNGVWNDYLKEIGAARKIDPAAISAQIENYSSAIKAVNGDLAKLALDGKLIDKLATRDEAEAYLIQKGVKEENSYRKIDFQDYAALVQRENPIDTRPQVGVVVAQGEISDGDQPAGSVGGESTAKLVRQARENKNIKAVVLRVNSPGGSAFASELIRREVELTKAAGKPVIVSMGDVAASGGYWISMNGDQIFAEPTTITGSIGIFGLFMNFPKTLAKINVHTDGVGTTPLAGALDPRRALDPKVGDIIQSIIDKGYQNFITKVAAARKKKPEEIDAIARGRVWSGTQAKERGLVDQLGGLREAAAAAAQAAKLGDNYQVRYVEKSMSTWERFVVSLSNDATAHIAQGLVPESMRTLLAQPDVQSQLKLLRSLDSNKVGVFAYCFCEIK